MEAKHTPGPWRIIKSTPSLIEALHHGEMTIIGQAFKPQGTKSIDEMRANARIMAAAPDLLAACKAAKKFLEPDLVEPGRTVFWKLVAAINKAGEQP